MDPYNSVDTLRIEPAIIVHGTVNMWSQKLPWQNTPSLIKHICGKTVVSRFYDFNTHCQHPPKPDISPLRCEVGRCATPFNPLEPPHQARIPWSQLLHSSHLNHLTKPLPPATYLVTPHLCYMGPCIPSEPLLEFCLFPLIECFFKIWSVLLLQAKFFPVKVTSAKE